MPYPLALFSLRPLNKRAKQVVAHQCNSHLVSTLKGGEQALDVGHIRSVSGDDATLATLGRCGDIFVDGNNISRIQCSFEIDRESNIVMFYDRSHGQTSQVYGEHVVPFEYGRPRKVVVHHNLNTKIGMGGADRNLVQFEIMWHCPPNMMTEKVKERQGNHLQGNPRLARTVDEAETVAPSRMETRIHTPSSRQPRMRWQQFGAVLGAGQYGTVYRAIDLDSGRTMAVKVMTRPHGSEGNHLWAKLKREVEILSRLSHTHIVDYIFSQGWEDGNAEIFMGLKQGTLESLVRRGCSAPARELASTVFDHMLQALDFLSTKDVIHRDLKPENILYISRHDGYYFQLGDFGLSNRQGLAATYAGTPIFMAPEVFFGGTQTTKADVWSLFVTILWTLDVGGFRELGEKFKAYDNVRDTVLSLAQSPGLEQTREMARMDPNTRASAAQMLVRCFGGVGLTTPRSQIPPIAEVHGDGTALPADLKGKAPAAVPNVNATGRTPPAIMNNESRMSIDNQDNTETTVTAKKIRSEGLRRAAKPLGIAKLQPRVSRRDMSRQADPVDVLLMQAGPVAEAPKKAQAQAGRRPQDSRTTNVLRVPGEFPEG